jgi:hypothetical protein
MMPFRMPILSGKFTGNISWKTMRLSFLVNSLLPKKVAWYGILLLAIPIRTKQANLDSQIAGAKNLVKKNWRNLQFLSANLYHTGEENGLAQ